MYCLPLWPGGNLGTELERIGKDGVADIYRRHLPDLLQDQGLRTSTTTVVLMLLYVLGLVSLSFGFAFLAIHVGEREAKATADVSTE